MRDDQVQFRGENSMASYYGVGANVTVRVFRRKAELVCYCLTDHRDDCQHAKRVQRIVTPQRRTEAA